MKLMQCFSISNLLEVYILDVDFILIYLLR